MEPPATRTLTVDGVDLEVVVVRKRVRNVNARLSGRRLDVSAPLGLAPGAVARAVEELARRLVRRARAREVNRDGALLELARRVARRFPAPPAVTAVRFVTTQSARWGSYSSATATVRLHAALGEMPAWVLEAVVAHELAHATHRHHSAAFWSLLRSVCPATERANAFLAGVSWLARRWRSLPPVERALLAAAAGVEEGDDTPGSASPDA